VIRIQRGMAPKVWVHGRRRLVAVSQEVVFGNACHHPTFTVANGIEIELCNQSPSSTILITLIEGSPVIVGVAIGGMRCSRFAVGHLGRIPSALFTAFVS